MDKIEKMRILPLLIASAAVLYSCDKKVASSTDSSAAATSISDSSTLAGTSAAVDLATDATVVVANEPSDKPALNPEHGLPYHRCEIPVGAPLDSSPAQNPAPQVVPQQSAANNSFNTNPISPSLAPSSAPAQATGPKPVLNPAHGEPHHRCDLEVGAPLI